MLFTMPRYNRVVWCSPYHQDYCKLLRNAQSAPDLTRDVRRVAIVLTSILGAMLFVFCFFILRDKGVILAASIGILAVGVAAGLGASLWRLAGRFGIWDERDALTGMRSGAVADTTGLPYRALREALETDLNKSLEELIEEHGALIAPFLQPYFAACRELPGLPANGHAATLRDCAHSTATYIAAVLRLHNELEEELQRQLCATLD